MEAVSTANYSELELTSHPEWAHRFWNDLVPFKDRIVTHPAFRGMADGSLDAEAFRRILLNFYPLVANFPAYMALNLAKATDLDTPGVLEARNWLITNIKIEERHLYWYRDWARGLGITDEEMDRVTPPPAMDAVNHYLWQINQRGTLYEGLAATNLAIEWPTGEWTQAAVRGMKLYQKEGVLEMNRRSMAWLRAHAHYDDHHPEEAMELIKRLCTDDESRERAFHAARRGMEYYLLAARDAHEPIEL